MSGFRVQRAGHGRKREARRLEADTARQRGTLLRERGLAPLAVDADRGETAGAPACASASARPATVAPRTRAGHAPVRDPASARGSRSSSASTSLIEQAESGAVRAGCSPRVRGDVLEGQSLARGLAAFPARVSRDLPRRWSRRASTPASSPRCSSGSPTTPRTARACATPMLTRVHLSRCCVTVVAVASWSALLVYVVPQVTRVFQNLSQRCRC